MTTQVQKAGSAQASEPSGVPRDERRSAFVLLACTVLAIAMIGLLLDSVTESFVKPAGKTPADIGLLIPGARDDFARAANARTLGRTSTGRQWRDSPGQWGIADHEAMVVTPAAGPSLATVPVGVPDGLVEAVISRMAPGAGIAFRCRNVQNCWRVEAVPRLGTWNVIRVVNGNEQRVASLGTVPVSDGTSVGVTMQGARLTFYIDGRKITHIDDQTFALEARAGLSLGEPTGAALARWSTFVASPPSSPGLLNVHNAELYDAFARTRTTDLGATRSSGAWTSVSGTWSVDPGQAGPTTPNPSGASLALVDLGWSNGVVQTTILTPQPSLGLAFRCRDLDNCWRLEVVAAFGTWNIFKVVDGRVTRLGNLGVVSTASGTTVSVEMQGPRLVFYVNGVEHRTIDDDTFAAEQHAGLVVDKGPLAAASRWSEFSANPGARP